MAIVRDVNPQCKIVVYRWKNLDPADNASDNELSESTALDVSSRLAGSVSFTKSMGSPHGTFSFMLANNTGLEETDWKDIIKRGTWCAIYMSQDRDLNVVSEPGLPKPTDPKKLRGICYIETVRAITERSSSEAFDVTYEVSGKDFGVVYSDTSIWNDLFRTAQSQSYMEAAAGKFSVVGTNTIDYTLKVIHDLMFNPLAVDGASVNDLGSIAATARQWLLPQQLIKDIGATQFNGQASFWGSIPNTFEPAKTAFSIGVANPVDFLTGNSAWEALKGASVPEFHELFTEINDAGFPQLVFRPIPWAKNIDMLSIAGLITKYINVPAVKVANIDVDNFSLGEDVHHIYNSFLVTNSSSLISVNDNISVLQGSKYPYHNQSSIKRHGFRPMHVQVNGLLNNAMANDGVPNSQLLVEYNDVLVDYWDNMEFAETGSLTMIGSNEIKIGKCLEFAADVPYAANRRYYIESYTDTFTIDDKSACMWTQEVSLTYGFEKSDLNTNANFSRRDEKFTKSGDFVKDEN